MILRVFLVLLILWFILRGILLYFLWIGNRSDIVRKEILKYFTEDDINNGLEYSRKGFVAKAIFGYLEIIFLLIFVYIGLNTRLYNIIEIYVSKNFWINSVFYFIAFSLIISAIELPFSFYLDYICEKEAGFSNMNALQWFWRWVKLNFVSIILQIIPLVLFIFIAKNFENLWHLIIPILFSIYGVIVTVIFPIVITPLFYEQKPLQNVDLKLKLLEIAKKADIDVDEVYEINESSYSKHTNAYFTGLGKRKRIVLFDNLLKNHTDEEILTIFAHEAGHWIHNHTLKGIYLGSIGFIIGCYILKIMFLYSQGNSIFQVREIWHPTMLPIIIILSIIFSMFISPIQSQISQYFERQADKVALELTNLKDAFIKTQIKLARDNKANLLPHPFRVFWLYSHPTTLERIKMAENWNK